MIDKWFSAEASVERRDINGLYNSDDCVEIELRRLGTTWSLLGLQETRKF